MADKRMFAKTIIDSDAFLDMPMSTQALYFHLCMRADDDGFVNNPKRIQRTIGSSDDDLKLLLAKRFVLGFESGVIVIKHWRLHNYIRKDTYKETVHTIEKSMLAIKSNGAYTDNPVTLPSRDCSAPVTQNRLDKNRLDKIKEDKGSEDGERGKAGRFTPPTLKEVSDYCTERKNGIDPQHFIDYYETRGWTLKQGKMKDWKAAIRTWEKREKEGSSGQASKPAGQCSGKTSDEKWGVKSSFTFGD